MNEGLYDMSMVTWNLGGVHVHKHSLEHQVYKGVHVYKNIYVFVKTYIKT